MKLLYITNIPAPYRQKRFNTMAEIFPKYGIDFEVLYMAKIENNRKWIIKKDSYKYQYRIYKGIHPEIGGFYAHFNPGLLYRLLKSDYQIAVVGGLGSPTHWLVPYFIRGPKKQIMSIESNLNSANRVSGIGYFIKKKILMRADAYQITGNPQKDYIEFYYKKANLKKFITLPNIIDENIYVDKINKMRSNKQSIKSKFNVDKNKQMWVLPSRLVEIKGIEPFLNNLSGTENIKLFILGDGPLWDRIYRLIYNLEIDAELVGFVQQDKLIEYYAAADVFVLPSIKDASPLSPIEAIAAGLPILVSSKIGNLADVLGDNNGWCYDPITENIKGHKLIRSISRLSESHLTKLGKNSYKRYRKFFSTNDLINKYAQQLLSIIEENE